MIREAQDGSIVPAPISPSDVSRSTPGPTRAIRGGGYLLVAVLLLAVIGLQLWLLGERWVNPDEGAHLMDVQLVLEGFIPGIDYGSRQPLYVYAYVPFLKLFGSHLVSGRLLAVLSTWLTAVVLFFLGRRLWNSRHGTLAAVLFLCTPSILINASVVKTEPLAMLTTSLGMWGLVVFLQGARPLHLVASGVAFGAGFYVRESTLGGLLAATIVVVLFSGPIGPTLRRLTLLYSGVAIASLGVLLWYSRYLGWGEMVQDGSLFPPYRVWGAVVGFFGPMAGEGVPDQAGWLSTVRESPQAFGTTIANITSSVRLNAPFALASLFALVVALRRGVPLRNARGRLTDPGFAGVTIALAWVMSIGLLYTYYAIERGFFEYYFREFIPPMALLLAWVLCRALERLEYGRYALLSVGIGLPVLTGAFFVERATGGNGVIWGVLVAGVVGWLAGHMHSEDRGRILGYVGTLTAFLIVAVLAGLGPLAGAIPTLMTWAWLGVGVLVVAVILKRFGPTLPGPHFRAAFVLVSLSAAAAGVSTYASTRIGLDYDNVWPPHVLRDVVEVIRANSNPGDSVLSGAVIWEFEAGRRTIANLTHPLAMRDSPTWEVPEEFFHELRTSPPQIIVLDGYTEQTHLPRAPQILGMLERDYALIADFQGGKLPVRVYRRSANEGAP